MSDWVFFLCYLGNAFGEKRFLKEGNSMTTKGTIHHYNTCLLSSQATYPVTHLFLYHTILDLMSGHAVWRYEVSSKLVVFLLWGVEGGGDLGFHSVVVIQLAAIWWSGGEFACVLQFSVSLTDEVDMTELKLNPFEYWPSRVNDHVCDSG